MAQQIAFFDFAPSAGMKISEVANALSVSEASVRNWIKTGYLSYDPSIGISRKSFDHFSQNVAGKDKLTNRANKSLVDTHDDDSLASKTIRALDTDSNLAELS